MRRFELTDAQWERLAPLLPPQKPRTGRPAEDHQQVLNGLLWILRTGAPWADLPARHSAVRTVSSRFYRWRNVRSWEALHRCWMSEMGAKPNFRLFVRWWPGVTYSGRERNDRF